MFEPKQQVEHGRQSCFLLREPLLSNKYTAKEFEDYFELLEDIETSCDLIRQIWTLMVSL